MVEPLKLTTYQDPERLWVRLFDADIVRLRLPVSPWSFSADSRMAHNKNRWVTFIDFSNEHDRAVLRHLRDFGLISFEAPIKYPSIDNPITRFEHNSWKITRPTEERRLDVQRSKLVLENEREKYNASRRKGAA